MFRESCDDTLSSLPFGIHSSTVNVCCFFLTYFHFFYTNCKESETCLSSQAVMNRFHIIWIKTLLIINPESDGPCWTLSCVTKICCVSMNQHITGLLQHPDSWLVFFINGQIHPVLGFPVNFCVLRHVLSGFVVLIKLAFFFLKNAMFL